MRPWRSWLPALLVLASAAGAFDYNLMFSPERATAVVARLVESYSIALGRLSAHGVGPLAPEEANRNDSGRSRNRRVEMVER